MKNFIEKSPLGIWVLPPHKELNDNYGVVPKYTDAFMNLRLSAASELTFSTPEKYYDEQLERWVDNPVYDRLKRGNVLYTNWDNEIQKCPFSKVGDKEFYYQGTVEYSENGDSSEGKEYIENINFSLKRDYVVKKGGKEHNLCFLLPRLKNDDSDFNFRRDINDTLLCKYVPMPGGTGSMAIVDGKLFSGRKTLSEIKDIVPQAENGDDDMYKKEDLKDLYNFITKEPNAEDVITTDSGSDYWTNETYYEVQNGDIIELWSFHPGEVTTGGNINRYTYKIFAYEEESEDTCLNQSTFQAQTNLKDENNKTEYKSLYHDYMTVQKLNDSFPFQGDCQGVVQIDGFDGKTYLRFCVHELHPVPNAQTHSGLIRVFPNLHYLSSANTIRVGEKGEPVEPEIVSTKYWIIDDIEINDEDKISIKKVKAYSYEVSLRDKWITLTDEVIGLYTPDAIIEMVQGDSFQTSDNIDVYMKKDTSFYDKYGKHIAKNQNIQKGILNLVLENCPEWKLGYISSDLMGKYRTFDISSNYNVYSLLTDTVSSLFHCFFIFDSVNMKINVYSKDDIMFDSDMIISKHNIIKDSVISSGEDSVVTKLHIHSADDTYGTSLVNPLGNDTIYNFDYYKEELENCGLYEKVSKWTKAIEEASEEYRNYAKKIITLNKEIVAAQSNLEKVKASYFSKVDVLNASDIEYRLPTTTIYSPGEIKRMFTRASKIQISGSQNLTDFQGLIASATDYETSLSDLRNKQKAHTNKLIEMKRINDRLSIEKFKGDDQDTKPLFTEEDLEILNHYIHEGDWTDENAVFLEEYTDEDIYKTLVDLYDAAKSDMNDFISVPNLEMNFSIANLFKIDAYKDVLENTFLGARVYVETNEGVWQRPVLSQIKISLNDPSDFEATFTTEYKRKPLNVRFSELFGSIGNISTNMISYTYSENE